MKTSQKRSIAACDWPEPPQERARRSRRRARPASSRPSRRATRAMASRSRRRHVPVAKQRDARPRPIAGDAPVLGDHRQRERARAGSRRACPIALEEARGTRCSSRARCAGRCRAAAAGRPRAPAASAPRRRASAAPRAASPRDRRRRARARRRARRGRRRRRPPSQRRPTARTLPTAERLRPAREHVVAAARASASSSPR